MSENGPQKVEKKVIHWWRDSLKITFWVFCLLLAYILFSQPADSFVVLVGYAVASTAGILIGTSFALGSLCYYFNSLSSKLFYRKYFGILGFCLAFSYSVLLMIINPEVYFHGFFDNVASPDFILGLTAMTIFGTMTAISNKWAMVRLGIIRWRYLLRLGYIAYFLLIIRAIILEKDIWQNWIAEPTGLPPVRMLLSLFAMSVIMLRASVIVAQLISRPQKSTSAAVPASVQAVASVSAAATSNTPQGTSFTSTAQEA